MVMNDINERVIEIVAKHLNVDKEDITEDSSFVNDLKADSLDLAELMMTFEEEFGCTIPDEKAEEINTIADAITFIKETVVTS